MSAQRSLEDRLLTEQERVDVAATRYPELLHRSRPELIELIRRLRSERDRAQTIGRQQRREIRGKADARGTRPARDNLGTVSKAQVLAQAVKRANKELARRDEPEPAPTQAELTRAAFERVQASRAAQHPSAGRTAGTGMRSNPSHRPTVQMDPREIGRVSQATRVAQAKHDR